MARRSKLSGTLLPVLIVMLTVPALGQTVRTVTVGEDGKPVVVETPATATPATGTPSAANPKPGTPGKPPTGKPDSGKPDDAKKDGDKKGDGKEGEADSKVVKRPMKTEEPAGPIAKEVEVEDSGKVTFSLKGQPWEAVLQWLADVSELSLDWQELPGDTLNLTTTRSYTLEEARDMINRHLLARGYCMVLNGELLSVLKTSDIKSSLVPRVRPENLENQMDHTLCKVSFDLNWLIADEAVEELAPMLSRAGRISKLSRTNRIEVMDTAASLKDIYRILQSEQSDDGQEQLVRTFRLEHRRANEVIDLLRTLLGMENEGGGGSRGGGMGDTRQITSMMQQMQQQLQRMGNSGSKGGGGGGKEPVKTRLVLNQRENMILAQAAPDQMAIIEKAISQIDVPVEASNSLLQNINKMRVYRMETVDPQTLVDLLQELGDMGPGTVLKVDEDKKSIVAFASLADHLTISTLVEKLDQSGRQVEVIPLRRLDAEYVAGTIQALMAPPPKENQNSRYGGFYSRFGSEPQKEEPKEFKVEPDIENNRILVYANKVEMGEIRTLLQKLGEIPDPDAVDNGIRVFEMGPEDDPREVMERIKQLWRRNNELQIDTPKKQPATDEDDASDSEPHKPQPAVERNEAVRVTPERVSADEFFEMLSATDATPPRHAVAGESSARPGNHPSWSPQEKSIKPQNVTVLTVAPDERANDRSRSDNDSADRTMDHGSPLKFSVTPDGNLIVSSRDAAALAEMEDLMKQLVRPAPKYKIFYLKYATPSWVTINLEEYFEADEESGSGIQYSPFYGFMPSTSNKSSKSTLGSRRQPQFIYDNFTSSILVRNADRRQLQTIEDLIKVYDVPEPADTRSMRVTKIFKLRNAKAESVAQAVKDVFRDLLSSNDKALEKNGEQKTQTRVYSYFGDSDEDDGDSPIRFKGLLSIGIEPSSDTLVVSSTASLMDTVGALIEELDKAADQSSSVQVLKIDPSVDIGLLQEKLTKALGPSSSEQQQPKGKNGRPPVNGVPVGAQPGQSE